MNGDLESLICSLGATFDKVRIMKSESYLWVSEHWGEKFQGISHIYGSPEVDELCRLLGFLGICPIHTLKHPGQRPLLSGQTPSESPQQRPILTAQFSAEAPALIRRLLSRP